MDRIRWANVARLVFALGAAALLAHDLPPPGADPPRAPALGLPEEVLRADRSRPPGPSRRPPPLRRATRPPLRQATPPAGAPPRRGSKRPPKPAPRPRPARPYRAPAAPGRPPGPAPSAPPTVGEFGP